MARFVGTFIVGVICSINVAFGQSFPNRPLRMFTSEAGGTADFVTRLIAPGLTSNSGQQAIVENRPSSGLAGFVAKTTPDGDTLLLTSGSLWLLPFLQDHVDYDPVKDFIPVSLTNRAPDILVVNPSLPVKSVKELIALAKAKPGVLDYAAGSIGSSPHLAGELFKAMAGVNMLAVTYKGIAPAMTDLLGGRVQLMFATPAAAAPHIKSGKLVALAVTSSQPSPLAPGLPTVAASGLDDYRSESVYGVWAPAGTPHPIIVYWNQEIRKTLSKPGMKEKFLDAGVETVGSSPEEFAALITSEMARMGKVIKDAGIRAD